MTLAIHLLGRPHIDRAGRDTYTFRSRKSWAVLAYLILSEALPTRSQLASLLFTEASDPLRALRWSLSEIRRCLGGDGSLDGDPLVLHLASDAMVDVEVVAHGSWIDAAGLPGLGADLLEGIAIRGAAAFESWLLSKRRHLAAASEAILHEAALGSMSRGALDTARGYAVRAAAMSPLDENHQALLIRLYRLAGEDDAAEKQYAAFSEVLGRELGVAPGPAVEAATREARHEREAFADVISIEAIVEAGSAAVSAGAIEAGIHSLRTAIRLADRADAMRLRVNSRLVLAEALIHSLGGLDEEGLAILHEADRIALATTGPSSGSAMPSSWRMAHRRSWRRRRPISARSKAIARTTPEPWFSSRRQPGCPALPATRGGRPSGSRCWAGSIFSVATWTPQSSSSTPRSASRNATIGCHFCPGPRRCRVRLT
jgi:DNA-binding SARP family transcriptional activator